jgi:hypothetical protein
MWNIDYSFDFNLPFSTADSKGGEHSGFIYGNNESKNRILVLKPKTFITIGKLDFYISDYD